jgi:hypothetical protein
MRAAPVDVSGTASVSVRLSGDLPGIARFLDALAAVAQTGGFEVPELPPQRLRAYPNRREPGYRVYVALRFPPEEDTRSCGAAHSRQAIRRPAAPSRRH